VDRAAKKELESISLLACDVQHVHKVKELLQEGSDSKRFAIKCPKCEGNGLARGRAIAFEVCKSFQQSTRFVRIHRIGAAEDANKLEQMDDADDDAPILLWVDIAKDVDVDARAKLVGALNSCSKNSRMLISC
jgi:hypothetical protein